jgi:CheY-like chemotaxis protein
MRKTTMPAPFIFLVDDDRDDQEIFSFILEEISTDIKLLCAADGVEAMQLLTSDTSIHPDYIFLDVNMPRMNGLECLSALRKLDRLAEIPIYLYSTSDEVDVVKQSLSAGPIGFVRKEANTDLVRQKLVEIFHEHIGPSRHNTYPLTISHTETHRRQ